MPAVVYPGHDVLGPLAFRSSAVRIPFVLQLMEGSWQGTRYQLLQVMEEALEGLYDVLLGNESLLTNEQAEFVLFVEPEEATKAQAIVDYMIGKQP